MALKVTIHQGDGCSRPSLLRFFPMQLMCDALAVLGSRHGLVFNPMQRQCGLLRFDRFDELPVVHLRAGVRIGGRECLFPFTPESVDKPFDFVDQRTSPCTLRWVAILGVACLKVTLTARIPFRPRDAAFSTIPVLGLELQVESLGGHYRWTRREIEATSGELFLEVTGPELTARDEDGVLRLDWTSTPFFDRGGAKADVFGPPRGVDGKCAQNDALVAPGAERTPDGFKQAFDLADPQPLAVFWCTHSEPILEVQGKVHPFRYTRQFADLDAVVAWARAHGGEIAENAAKVDGIIGDNNASPAINRMMAYTLHSWLLNTWWVDRDGVDWLSVWEGSCFFHSTIDVEFTQSPFYLAVWPELLGHQLRFWPEFQQPGEEVLGEGGEGTAFLSHDVGLGAAANGQVYPHHMPVEETANYVILAYAYWRRSGDDAIARQWQTELPKYLDFLVKADTTGNGVPDQGVANTIDDASPAIQFGLEQVYLAIKTLAALDVGAELLTHLGDKAKVGDYRAQADRIRKTLTEKGWADDHFVTLLRKAGTLKDPWSGEVKEYAEIPGWDAPHIYAANGLAVLDMLGVEVGVDPDWVKQDLEVATARCLREYGCCHTDFQSTEGSVLQDGLAGSAPNPGWIAMNLLRDIAAFHRGVDWRDLAERYWDWQTTTNTQEAKLFFETFGGNNLNWYPRGIAAWGHFEALAGLKLDVVGGRDEATRPFPEMRLPRLFDADWKEGTATVYAPDQR